MQNTIKDYKIVFDPSQVELVRKVKNEMNYGWQPIGGVAATDYNFYQAMIKFD